MLKLWVPVFLLAGCNFGLAGVNPDAAPVLMFPGGPSDLGSRSPADLAGSTPDLAPTPTVDPCGTAPAAVAGAVVAGCVLGAPPTIDGDLSDWSTTTFTAFTHASVLTGGGAAAGSWDPSATSADRDCSGAFALRWDAQNLYLAVKATDDVRGKSGQHVYNDDALEVFFDGGGDNSGAYGADDLQFIIAADGRAKQFIPGPETDAPSVYKIKPVDLKNGTSASWVLEMAVPWTQLGPGAGANGRLVGFDLQIDDDDDAAAADTARAHTLVWKSNGAGDLPYTSTALFGKVQLGAR